MNQKNKVYMLTLCFELTRKCNLKCRWCSKGDVQNVDITKQIIDKTLDEVQGFYIDEIAFHGGEPMLNPNMFQYLAEQIVRRNIKVRKVFIMSNATIQDGKIKKAILTLSDYFEKNKNSSWMKESDDFFLPKVKFADMYKEAENKNIAVILSTYEHNNENVIDKTMRYYELHRDNAVLLKQQCKNGSEPAIAIEGKAAETWQTFSKKELRRIIIINNQYNFIRDDFKNTKLLHKTLTVSANGNVFAGKSLSYDHVDEQPMFNILDCNNDFYKKVSGWCWEHPINQLSNKYRKQNLAIEWQKEHGIKPLYDDRTIEYIKTMSGYANLHEQELIKCHKLLPKLGHTNLNQYVALRRFKNRFCYEITENQKNFLRICGGFDRDYIESLNLDNEKVAAICEEFEKAGKTKFKGA